LIRAESKGPNYLVRFTGSKSQFTEYIKKISAVKSKAWDNETKSWIIPKTDFPAVVKSFKYIEYVEEAAPDDVSASYERIAGIGDDLKLPPYEYQKEAIQFSLNNPETLLILPCGAGKTVVGIGLYIEAIKRGLIEGPGMIIVKASLKTQWLKEVGKFSDLSANIIRTHADATSNIHSKINLRRKQMQKMISAGYENRATELQHTIDGLEEQVDGVFEAHFSRPDIEQACPNSEP
jgi:N12 class adenine-specific DNA methylase